jgi:hypothetical protein
VYFVGVKLEMICRLVYLRRTYTPQIFRTVHLFSECPP